MGGWGAGRRGVRGGVLATPPLRDARASGWASQPHPDNGRACGDPAGRSAVREVSRSQGMPEGSRKPLAPPGAPFPLWRERKGTGQPAPCVTNGEQSVGFCRHSGAERSEEPGIHKHGTREGNVDGAISRSWWLWIPVPALRAGTGMTRWTLTLPIRSFIINLSPLYSPCRLARG